MPAKIAFIILAAFIISSVTAGSATKGETKMKIMVTSSAFSEGGMIPNKYTCDGDNVSPPLAWSGIPTGTKSIALIADDPDAPAGTWVHWVVYNLPPDLTGLPENAAGLKMTGRGTEGQNDFRRLGYGGPCPPGGTHRYSFKIYALDALLDLDKGAIKNRLLKAMEGHILGEGALMGKYKR